MTAKIDAGGVVLAKHDKFKGKGGEQVKTWFKDNGRPEAEGLLWTNKNKCLESACTLHGIAVAQYEVLVTQGLVT